MLEDRTNRESSRVPNQFALLISILASAFAIRIIVYALLPDQSGKLHDIVSIRGAAQELIQTGQTHDIFVMPLYPLLVGLVGPGLGQAILDISLSTITVWLVYQLASELFKDRVIAITAAIGVTLYPSLIFFSVVGLTESLFVTLVLASFLLWYRGQFALGSVFAVLAILTRPAFDLAAPLLIVVFSLVIHRLTVAATLKTLLIYAVIYCTLLTPWWVHNYKMHGEFVRLIPGSGTVFYAGNNPMNHSGSGNLGVDYVTTQFDHLASPIARERAMSAAAIDFIANNPGRFVELAELKFVRLWRLWPANEGYVHPLYIFGALVGYVPVLLLTLIYLARWAWQDFRKLSPILLFAAYTTTVHMVIVSTIRYRLPLEPFMIILGVAAFIRLFRSWRPGHEFLERWIEA